MGMIGNDEVVVVISSAVDAAYAAKLPVKAFRVYWCIQLNDLTTQRFFTVPRDGSSMYISFS